MDELFDLNVRTITHLSFPAASRPEVPGGGSEALEPDRLRQRRLEGPRVKVGLTIAVIELSIEA